MTESHQRIYQPINPDKLKTYPTEQRRHLVDQEKLAQLPENHAVKTDMPSVSQEIM